MAAGICKKQVQGFCQGCPGLVYLPPKITGEFPSQSGKCENPECGELKSNSPPEKSWET